MNFGRHHFHRKNAVSTLQTAGMLPLALGIAAPAWADSGSDPVLTVIGFYRDSDATACAAACSAGGCDDDSTGSSDFFDIGDNLVIEVGGAEPGCQAEAAAISWMSATRSAPGPVMELDVDLMVGCIPDAVCPISGSMFLTPEAESQGGTAQATSSAGTTWWVMFTVHETADITVTGHYHISALISGNADQSNAYGLVRQTIQGPGFETLDEQIAEIGFVGNSIDEETDSPVFTIQDAAPGNYLVGGTLTTSGGVFFNNDNTGDSNFTHYGESFMTIRVDAGVPSPADLNQDGVVDVADLLQLIAAWGSCFTCPEDIDGNGVVDVADLLTLLAEWS